VCPQSPRNSRGRNPNQSFVNQKIISFFSEGGGGPKSENFFLQARKSKFPNFFLLLAILDVIFKSVSTVNFYYPTTPVYTHLPNPAHVSSPQTARNKNGLWKVKIFFCASSF